MKYETLSSLAYPHGAAAQLDDSLEYLRIADYAGATSVDADIRSQGGLALYQAMHDYYGRELSDPRYAVVRDQDGVIVASAIYSVVSEYRYASLDILAVDETHRNQKLGHGLLDFVIREAQQAGAESILLTSAPDAYEFYAAHGFDDIDEDPDSDCRRMAKIIAVEQ